MDSIYDIENIYNYIIKEAKGQAIISYNKKGSLALPSELSENLHPICSMGLNLLTDVSIETT
ncbi:hypothetical protein FDN13_10290 [Caloramator sp. E03]|nr:hypothetical protein FDN13_10290 [Caloramator sp. E03]